MSRIKVQSLGNDGRVNYGASRRSTNMRLMMEELRAMSEEELREASLEKAPNNCATKRAIEAQRMLYERRWGAHM